MHYSSIFTLNQCSHPPTTIKVTPYHLPGDRRSCMGRLLLGSGHAVPHWKMTTKKLLTQLHLCLSKCYSFFILFRGVIDRMRELAIRAGNCCFYCLLLLYHAGNTLYVLYFLVVVSNASCIPQVKLPCIYTSFCHITRDIPMYRYVSYRPFSAVSVSARNRLIPPMLLYNFYQREKCISEGKIL